MSGVSETVDYQLKQIFDSVDKPEQYMRIDEHLQVADTSMDNASPENLAALQEEGINSVRTHDLELNRFAKMLLDS